MLGTGKGGKKRGGASGKGGIGRNLNLVTYHKGKTNIFSLRRKRKDWVGDEGMEDIVNE